MTIEINNTKTLFGKPWSTDSTHESYDDADQRRNDLKNEPDLDVKVKCRPVGKRSPSKFDVRVRSAKLEQPKKNAKKNKNKTKRNSKQS